MRKYSTLTAIMYAIFILIGMSFFTAIALLFSALSGYVEYVPVIIIIAITLYSWFVLLLFHFFQTKRRKIVFISIAITAILIGMISPIQHAYKNNIPTMNTEVYVYEYTPFSKNARIATLDEPSTLRLSDDLPRMDGATALYPLYSAFVQATYPEQEYTPFDSEVMVNTTPDAYSNLFAGKVDMIFVAAPSNSQLKIAQQKGVELNMIPIGREAFVFFVNQKNTVNGLKFADIQDIYSGKVTNWNEVGGANDSIRAFQRPADSGSQTALEKVMGETPIMKAPHENISSGMGGIINEVSQYRNYKNALGYTFRFYSTEMIQNDQIKLLEIDGVAPTKETIRSDAYPLTSEFYIVTTGTKNENVQKFINWILSEQGQLLVEKSGYVAIN
ncbi:PstS family phosphate ABC transporter substrate-binding protein [Sporosarcina siberiensis]|uniref:PstS family phosphate ABC transporter substrate-binding protein n=1 Tax=Sporosarcina siberiensis TaxID=1365606 RepID=A0ABW4SKG3_9BACL